MHSIDREARVRTYINFIFTPRATFLRDDGPVTDDQPQGPITHFGRISNDHNSAMRQPIPFMFGSRVGFSGTADRTVPFPVGSDPRWRLAAILESFKWPYLSNASWPNLGNALSSSLYACTQTILCPQTLICNDRDLKLTSQGRFTSRPTV